MNKTKLSSLLGIDGVDYGNMKASEFEDFICNRLLKYGKVKRQFQVKNRGDGHKGRIDVVFEYEDDDYAIEIDRVIPRKKSIYKVVNFNLGKKGFVITRSPVAIHEFIINEE
jgi:hypothetical protein